MTIKRKTGKDYKNELEGLNDKLRSLEAKVDARLLELVTAYPDVDLPTSRAGSLKCKNIAHKWIIQDLTVKLKIEYIQAIEKHLENIHPHKQLNIFKWDVVPAPPVGERIMFDGNTGKAYSRTKEDPICNCDGRDMPVYEEDGKRWCPQCGYEVK